MYIWQKCGLVNKQSVKQVSCHSYHLCDYYTLQKQIVQYHISTSHLKQLNGHSMWVAINRLGDAGQTMQIFYGAAMRPNATISVVNHFVLKYHLVRYQGQWNVELNVACLVRYSKLDCSNDCQTNYTPCSEKMVHFVFKHNFTITSSIFLQFSVTITK